MKNLRYIIRETLSKTYSLNLVFKYLSKHLEEGVFHEINDVLKIEVTHKNYEKLPKVIESLENLYGWYLAGAQYDLDEPFDRDVENIKSNLVYNAREIEKDLGEDMDGQIVLHFLEKYGKKVQVPDIVYHVTSGNNLSKILKYGLVPKSKSKKAFHPDRVYVATELSGIQNLVNDEYFDIDNPTLLTIDISDIKDSVDFFEDPHFSTGVYTFSNIRPENIIDYKNL